MNLFQTTDHHLKDEEPFFQAGKALDTWLLKFFEKQTEPFVYLDSGDRYHVSKETGRVNGEVARFFVELSSLPLCQGIWVMQGNHDFKVDTGSAVSILENLSSKIKVVREPMIVKFPEQKGNSLLLPHMKIKNFPYFTGRESYGKKEFYEKHFKNWDEVYSTIEFVSAHLGDETCGSLLQDADLSLFSCMKSNGHIHKTVSKTQLESAAVTRRDEIDKRCIMREFHTEDFSSFKEIPLPLFLNYAKIKYGDSVENYFKDSSHIMPKTSLIVDIFGHDNEDFVKAEYSRLFENTSDPTFYIGEIATEERLLSVEEDAEREDLDIADADLIKLLEEFCKEKNVTEDFKQKLLKRISQEETNASV